VPFYLFFPKPVVDFWLFPDRIFDETYELNASWDFFGNPNVDETYDGWPGAPTPTFLVDYEFYDFTVSESYEDGYWNDNAQLLYPDTTSMSLWLDSQDNNSLLLDIDGYVHTWINKSYSPVGDGYQGTSSLRPYPVINDGYQYLNFSGDWMSFTHTSGETTRYTENAPNSRNWHLFAVFKVANISTNSGTPDSNDGLISTLNLTTRHNIHFRNSPNRIVVTKADASALTFTQNINLNQNILVEMYHSTTNDNLNYKNSFGFYLNSAFIGELNATTTAGNTTTYVGRNSGGTAFFQGILGEIIMYKCHLPQQSRIRNINYLKNKWGII
jgi:hypothetical protein